MILILTVTESKVDGQAEFTQVRLYIWVDVIFWNVSLPLSGLFPPQDPEAKQEVAFVTLQVTLITAPELMVIGPSWPLALISTVGTTWAKTKKGVARMGLSPLILEPLL